jgi:PAS domain S-box-containing protein
MVLKKEISLQIKNLLKAHPQGLRITDIIKKVNINRNTAGRYLENLLVSGQVEMRRFGMAKIYTLSQRVPLSALLSISSELVLQLDNSLRIIYANEPFLLLVGTDIKNLSGKNIEFTPVALLFDEEFSQLLENIRKGIAGKEWSGEIYLIAHYTLLFCRIAPTVFEDGRKGVSIIFEDITQQKKTEEALKKSEIQYGSLIETTGTGYVILDQAGLVITANQEYVRLTGRSTLAEIIGKPVTDWTAPYDLERNIREIKRCMRQGKVRDLEIDYQKPDGTIQPIEINASVIQSGPDQIILTLCRDITRRRKNEDALRDSEDKYRKLVEISPDAVIIHQEGKISYVNPAAFKLLGALNPDEIIGKNVLEFIHPDFRESVMNNIHKDLKGEISPSTELHMRRLDGTSVIVEGRGVRTIINGNPAIQVAIRDITERKNAEDALRESEGKLNAMLQSIPDIMSLMDEKLTIMWANEPAKRYFGEDIVGKKCYEVYHLIQGPCEPYPCLTLKAFLDGKMHQHETTVIDSQGETRFFECTASVALRDNSGKPVAVLEISRDITDKKMAEDALRESEEKYRTLVDRANDGIVVIQDNIVKMCNHYITEFWGGSIDQIIGRNFMDFIHPEALSDVVNRYKRRMVGEPLPSIYESILKRKDGSGFFAELNAGIITYDGRPADLIIVRDINDRKNMEMALREQSFDAIVIHKDRKIAFLNKKATKILGAAEPEDLMGRSIYDFIHPDSLQDLEARLRKLSTIPGTPVPVLIMKFFRVDRKIVTAEVMAMSFIDNGIPAVRVTFREIASP